MIFGRPGRQEPGPCSFRRSPTPGRQFACPGESKPVVDEIDRVLVRHYGFTDEKLDFITNYDIKYRLGRGTETEEE